MCGVEQLPSVTSQEAEDVLLWSEKNTLIKLGHVKLIFGSSFVNCLPKPTDSREIVILHLTVDSMEWQKPSRYCRFEIVSEMDWAFVGTQG